MGAGRSLVACCLRAHPSLYVGIFFCWRSFELGHNKPVMGVSLDKVRSSCNATGFTLDKKIDILRQAEAAEAARGQARPKPGTTLAKQWSS
jgi:hypothetical protein